jgi:hypothetical protein
MKNTNKNKNINQAEHCHQNGVPLFLCDRITDNVRKKLNTKERVMKKLIITVMSVLAVAIFLVPATSQAQPAGIVNISGYARNSHGQVLSSTQLGDGLKGLEVRCMVYADVYDMDRVSLCQADCYNNPGTCPSDSFELCKSRNLQKAYGTDTTTLGSSGHYQCSIDLNTYIGATLLVVENVLSYDASLTISNEDKPVLLSETADEEVKYLEVDIIRAPDFIAPGGLVRAFRRSVNNPQINPDVHEDLPLTPYPMVYLEGNDPKDLFTSDGYLWVMSLSCLDLADNVYEPINDSTTGCFDTTDPGNGKCCDVSLLDYFFSNGYTVWFLMTEMDAGESRVGTSADDYTDGVDYQYMWAVKQIIQLHESAFPNEFRGVIIGGFSGGATSTLVALPRWCAGEWDTASETNGVVDGILPTSWCDDENKIAGWYAGDGGHRGAQATAALLRVMNDIGIVEALEAKGLDIDDYRLYINTDAAYEWLIYSITDVDSCSTGCADGDCTSYDLAFRQGCNFNTSIFSNYRNVFGQNRWPRRNNPTSGPLIPGVLWSNGGPPGEVMPGYAYNEKNLHIHTKAYITCPLVSCCILMAQKYIETYLNTAGGNGYGDSGLNVPGAFGEHVNGSIFSQVKGLNSDGFGPCRYADYVFPFKVFAKTETRVESFFPFMPTQTALNCSKDNCLTDPNGGPMLATDYTYNTTGQLMDHMAPFSMASSKILAGFMHEQLKGNKSSSPICSDKRDVGMKASCRLGSPEIMGNGIDDDGDECVDDGQVPGGCITLYPPLTQEELHLQCCAAGCAFGCYDAPGEYYADCMELCGQGECSEFGGSCAVFGQMGYCGDSDCGLGETCSNCSDDCNPCCGNSDCDYNYGESYLNCPADCPCRFNSECDDGNVCTTDSCSGGSCSSANNTAACSDGNFCNGPDTCSNGSCSVSDGDPCSADQDFPFCNESAQRCDQCTQDSDCADDGNVCTDHACDVDEGVCVVSNNTASCDDGLWCNGTDTCSEGACGHAGDPCGAGETCNEATDSCDVCTTNADCNDGNVCTTDTCSGGQCSNVNNTASCDDGLFCNGADTCSSGTCTHAGDPCSGGDTCNESYNRCDECQQNSDCDDGNLCTTDTCSSGQCSNVNNSNSCSDGNACTVGDTCSGGSCQAGSALNCNDSNVCTNDSCDPGSGCQYVNNTVSCNDGLFCNGADTCSGGSCTHAGDPCGSDTCNETTNTCDACQQHADCNDGNVCTTDSCSGGQCSNVNNTASCDDGLFCNGTDTCSGGSCSSHTGDPCSGGDTCNETMNTCDACQQHADCDDGNPCTDDECSSGQCLNWNNSDSCDDGLFCNGADTCSGGVCTHAGNPCSGGDSCNETTNSCDSCTTNADCNDGNVCTTDTCSSGQCSNVNNSASCDDGLFCNGADTCSSGSCSSHAGDPCGSDICNESTNACDPAGGDCDNNNICDTGNGEDCSNCPGDCGVCGSGGCDGSHCGFTFCSASCPCTYGQADCDSNADCVDNLVCGWQKGEDFGCDPSDAVDSCVPIGEANIDGYCGDGTCYDYGDADEDETNCPQDCGAGCTPDCSGKNCGDDGCGGSCGTCSGDQVCNSGICEDPASSGSDIGHTTVFSDISDATDRRAQPVTATETGELQSVSIYHNGDSGSLILAIYADNNGYPGTRLGVTAQTALNSSQGWQTVPLTSPVSVTANQEIWLAWVSDVTPGIRYELNSPGRAASGVGWSGGMPTEFGSSSIAGAIYSIYATYSGGSCTPDCSGKNCGDDGCGGSCGTCSGDQTCQSGVCTDPPASGCTVISGGGSWTGSTSGESNELDGYCHANASSGIGDVCYEWTATVDGSHQFDTCSSNTNFDTMLYLYNADGTQELICNDDEDAICAGNRSIFDYNVTQGQTYRIYVDGYDEEGAFELTITAPAGCTPDCSGKNCGDDGCGGSCGTCSGDQTCQSGVCTDPPASGCTVISGGGSWTGDTTGLSSNIDGYCANSTDTGIPDKCYEWTATVSGSHEFSLCGSGTNFDTMMYIYDVTGTQQLECNDDSSCAIDDHYSIFNYDATANTVYRIYVEGFDAADYGSFELSITAPAGGGSCDNDNTCDTGSGEDCSTCPADCGVCGSGGCDGSHCGFTFCSASCPCTYGQADCDSNADCVDNLVCGWQKGEDFGCDPSDAVDACVPIGEANIDGYCGDGICYDYGDADEDETNCPQDCGSGPTCGDSSCDSGEDCSSCPADCGSCASGSDIGYTTVFSEISTATDRRAQPVTATETGELQSVSIYHNGDSGSLILAIYADNNGYPGTRLGVTAQTALNSSQGWQTVPLTSPVSVTANQEIWLAWVSDVTPGIRYELNNPGRAASGVGWSGGMPTDFGSSSVAGAIYSIYATYSGGGCTPDCSGKNCGDDGCGGSCGTCSGDQTCQSGVCTDPSGGGGCTGVPLGDSNFCKAECPCLHGQGDCDSDAECVAGTVCGTNNGLPDFGIGNSETDACYTP